MQLDYKAIDFNTKWILSGSSSIIYRETLNSTLSIALDKQHQINDKGKIVITDNQTSGKGTHGKQWISTAYKDLTFSIILGNENSFGQLSSILTVLGALLAALGAALGRSWLALRHLQAALGRS